MNIDFLNILPALVAFFSNQDLMAKIILLLLLIIYLLFALILTRQIFYFNTIINQVTFSPVFKILALIHLAFATILLVSIALTL